MKKFLFISFIIVGILYACEEEPAFPDPGFDATSDVVDTVRRDTIDTYLLKIDMNVPNGVKTIQVLDGITYQTIEEIADYNGEKNVAFEYAVDLSDITDEQKTLYYIVKVIDNDLRTINKAFSVTVKPFSEPTITYPIEGILGVVSPVFKLSAFFETGLYQMTNFKLTLGTEVLDEGTFDAETYEYDYAYVCNLEMVDGQEYTLTMELTDERGEVRTKDVIVTLMELTRPIKVLKYLNRYDVLTLTREYEFVYRTDNPELLDSIAGYTHATSYVDGLPILNSNPFSYKFTHNVQGMVESIEYWRFDSFYGDGWIFDNSWTYAYDDNQRFVETRGIEASSDDIKVIDWYDDGRVKTYMRDPDYSTEELDMPYYTNVAGEQIQGESWIRVKTNKRTMVSKVSPIAMPTWYPALPAFIPTAVGRHEELEMLTMWRYGLEGIAQYNSAYGTDLPLYADESYYTYRYQTDVNGRIEALSKFWYSSYYGEDILKETYYFVYE